jgi:hypothetical protein
MTKILTMWSMSGWLDQFPLSEYSQITYFKICVFLPVPVICSDNHHTFRTLSDRLMDALRLHLNLNWFFIDTCLWYSPLAYPTSYALPLKTLLNCINTAVTLSWTTGLIMSLPSTLTGFDSPLNC